MIYHDKIKLLIISEPGSGGVKRHVMDLLNNLNKDRFEIIYAYSKKRADKDYLSELDELSYEIQIKEIHHLQQTISIKTIV